MDSSTDNSLMLRVKEGDIDKMGLLFDRYNRQLYGFLYHSTGQRVDAEDLVQTVFYRMLKYRHTFTGEGEFRTWMYHLARNALIDTSKKASRIKYEADVTLKMNGNHIENPIDRHYIKNEEEQNIRLAISKLKEDQREVLIMSKYQELNYKEIAEILQTTEGNIKVKVYRAVQELRSIYLKLN
ncbi:MAG: RNA polymerase sigma factor [Bacteroidota bacterium]